MSSNILIHTSYFSKKCLQLLLVEGLALRSVSPGLFQKQQGHANHPQEVPLNSEKATEVLLGKPVMS